MIGYIYIWVSITNKIYVGQTRQRYRAERYKDFPDLWKNVKIITYQNITDEQLNYEESKRIKRYNSMIPNGYNKEPGGGVVRQPKVMLESHKQVREYFEQGLSYRDIMKIMDMSSGAVWNIKKQMDEEAQHVNGNIDYSEAKFLPIQLEFNF